MASKRTLEFVFAGDPKSLERAFAQSGPSPDKFAVKVTRL
jgi:hypothetical protein